MAYTEGATCDLAIAALLVLLFSIPFCDFCLCCASCVPQPQFPHRTGRCVDCLAPVMLELSSCRLAIGGAQISVLNLLADGARPVLSAIWYQAPGRSWSNARSAGQRLEMYHMVLQQWCGCHSTTQNMGPQYLGKWPCLVVANAAFERVCVKGDGHRVPWAGQRTYLRVLCRFLVGVRCAIFSILCAPVGELWFLDGVYSAGATISNCINHQGCPDTPQKQPQLQSLLTSS
jgi:hypothetical protein